MRRRGLVAVIIAIAVLSATIGWFAGQRIKSPAEIAAEQAPPAASLITVPVEKRELSQNLVVRGTVRSDESTPLEANSASGETIITRLTKEVGSELVEGDVVIEVAGRPIFVLQGQLPVFRNFIPTLEGPDVQQLEESLVRLGYDVGTVDGVYDGATADAVESLYRDAGYKPVEPTDDDLAGLKAQRNAVTDAESAVADAQKQFNLASAGPSDLTKLEQEQIVNQAKAELADAEAGGGVAEATEQRKQAEAAAAAAKTDADEAAARLAQAEGGTHPDTNTVPTQAELDALTTARDETAQTKTEADAAALDAKNLETAAIADQDGAVQRAKLSLALAEANRDEALATDSTDAAEQLRRAREQLTDARADLAKTQAVVDTEFPAAELYFLPSLPRKIQSLTVEPGERPQGPVMTVTGSGTSITSGVASSDRRLISVGDVAILEDEDLGIRAEAKINFIAENPGGGETPSDRYLIRIEPDEDLPEEALGVNFRITIPVTSSGGEVLAVPLAALSAGSDGTTRVEVERSDGETELVQVVAGLKASGFVQVEAVDGSLEEGQRVVVGRDLVLPGQDQGEDESEQG